LPTIKKSKKKPAMMFIKPQNRNSKLKGTRRKQPSFGKKKGIKSGRKL
jgi:hypothetical protein